MLETLQTLEEWLADPRQRLGESNTYNVGSQDQLNRGRPCGWLQLPRHLAQPFNVTLSRPTRSRPSVPAANNEPDASTDVRETFARIVWGIDGFSQTVEIDWGQGGVYTLHGSFIEVRSVVPVGPAANTGGPMQLGATISPALGVTGRMTPTRTRFLGTVAALAVVNGTVPPFAKRAHVLVEKALPNEIWKLQFFRVADTVALAEYELQASANRSVFQVGDGFRVPVDATQFQFTNLDAGAAMNSVQVVFELAL